MLSKEEKLIYSLSALKEVIETFEIDVNVSITKNNYDYTINAYKEIEKCVVDYVNSLQPYEFEDLKVGMWVYDSIYKSAYLIKEISKNKKIRVCTFGWIGEFEENRFFPVQMANVIGNEESEN